MKKFLYHYRTIIFLVLGVASLNAQDQSRLNQAIATLEEYAVKLPQAVKKTINCARGIESCTQAEITQTRAILGVIGAALTVVALGITAGVTAKAKGWWPFRKSTMKVPPIFVPVTQQQTVDAASNLSAIYNLALTMQKLPETQKIIQANIDIIDAAINQGLIGYAHIRATIPNTDYTLEEVIKHFITQGATSKNIQ